MAGNPPLIAAALGLRADVVTSEVVQSLGNVSIEPILLRGPAIARLLCEPEGARTYGDVDLLVSPHDLARAEGVLSRLGFDDRTVAGVIEGDRPTYAHTWVRSRDGAVVDVHVTLSGARAAPPAVVEVCRGQTETLTVGSTDVSVFKPPGRAVVIALHAAAHGARVPKPMEDLERALERLPYETWEAGAVLAGRLGAAEAFEAGLRLAPAGEELADRLGLSCDVSVETALQASTPPPTALGFEWLARTHGMRAKMRFLARKLLPNAGFMRAWSSLARRGSVGLSLAYVWRVLWLAGHAPSGFSAWARARITHRSSGKGA